VLAQFPLVAAVEIEIRKPAAPIGGILDHAAVRLSLQR
jgi:dihydroneopterin aldolase